VAKSLFNLVSLIIPF